MGKPRPLRDTESVATFLTDVLNLDPRQTKNAHYCTQIRDVEQLLQAYKDSDTLTSNKYRDSRFMDESSRYALRTKIIWELLSLPRLPNDDAIRPGKGGLLLDTGFRKGSTLFFVTGLPASGKSGIATKIALGAKAVILDSDYAKRKFPEFKKDYGPALVHEEASIITEGLLSNPYYNDVSILEYAMANKYNIVLPKIGKNFKTVRSIVEFFHNNKYSTYFIHVRLNPEEATKRAWNRFRKTKRYVPLALIYDGYGFEPLATYYQMREVEISTGIPMLEGHLLLSTECASGYNIEEERNCKRILRWLKK